MTPAEGVYYTKITVQGEEYDAMTSIGRNPSISEGNPLTIESYLLDFQGELYGEKIHISFLRRIREQLKFDTLSALQEQLQKDLETVKGMREERQDTSPA